MVRSLSKKRRHIINDHLILPCTVGGQTEIKRCIIDTGCTYTYITDDIVRECGLQVHQAPQAITYLNAAEEKFTVDRQAPMELTVLGKTSTVDALIDNNEDTMILGMDFLTGLEITFVGINKIITNELDR